jgi:uncharacterized protein YecE (DUF72 family)
MTELRIGTSAWVASGWQGWFYPAGMKPADYLTYYATKFDTVEVDSTFYRAPSVATVNGWRQKTPQGFILAAKIPQVITHDKCLQDCDEDLREFLDVMDRMGNKLGPLLFQFGYFNKSVFPTGKGFLDRLAPFLKKLPKGYRFAVEIRNKHWLTAEFFDLLREHQVAYALTDHFLMPGPGEIYEKVDPITADFTYIRWLGDRKGIEQITKVWNRIVVDRTAEMSSWVDVCTKIQKRGVNIYAYFNNHYAGFGPASVQLFRDLAAEKGLEIPVNTPATEPPAQPSLF